MKQLRMSLSAELIVDLFAGGGGASLGIEMATGRMVDIAINHDMEAVAMHQANHPTTQHFISDVFEVDPRAVTNGRPVGLLWASPDCKHFSKAKGGQPVSKKIRSLAWVVVKWAKQVRPRVICLENVEEFQGWGPVVPRLDTDGNPIRDRSGKVVYIPCPKRKGDIFRLWKGYLESFGYRVEYRELKACDYGAPTIRKRLFLVARCDGLPIVWPEPTHADPTSEAVRKKRLKPWRTAAECINWSIPCYSIFLSPEEAKKAGVRRPLADATLRRTAKGLVRFVIESPNPFIIPVTHQGQDRAYPLSEPARTITAAKRGELALIAPVMTEVANASSPRCNRADEPLRTICAETKGGHHALIAPFLSTYYGDKRPQDVRGCRLDEQAGTQTTENRHALVTPFLAKHFTGAVGSDLRTPAGTITSVDHHSLIASHLVKLRNNCVGQEVSEPLHTITGGAGHFAEVRAFLVKYYGQGFGQDLKDPAATVTTKDRLGLVTVQGEDYAIVDIGFRMLQPRELFLMQGFPPDYIIGDAPTSGIRLTKEAQVRMCGNSVCPPVAAALVRANYRDIELVERVA